MSCKRWLWGLAAGLAAVLAPGLLQARVPCGGCADPCASYRSVVVHSGPCGPCGAVTASAPAVPASHAIDPGPQTELRVELVPTYVTEKRTICTTEYKDEQLTRVVPVTTTVPVTEERVRVSTVMVPKTETKTIEYMVSTPVQSEATKTYKIKVPVYTDQEEEITIQVPVLKEVDDPYTVKVPVLKDVEFTYTVHVPQAVTRTVNRTVTNATPVVKTKTISHCVPVTSTKTVTVDRGHWENQMVEVAVSQPCGTVVRSGCGGCGQVVGCGGCGQSVGCGGCGSPCGSVVTTQVVCKRVWVPNQVTEQVTEVTSKQESVEVEYLAYEQQTTTVPFECTTVVYQPETRKGVKKEVAYEDKQLTRKRTIVEYKDEKRKRLKKVLTFKEETRSETYPVITYKQEKKTKDVTYTVQVPETKVETYSVTRHDTVTSHKLETYTAKVAVPAVKEVEVQVCKMVPKVVSVSVNPCATSAACSSGCGGCGSVIVPGCGGCGAPVVTSGCGGCGQ